MELSRRKFLQGLPLSALALTIAPNKLAADKHQIILPPRLNLGDTIGLITPASALFEPHQTLIEAKEKMKNLGFDVKLGNNILARNGYLAGTDAERVSDIHQMFTDDTVKGIIAVRGGYGSGRLLKDLDYELISDNPKIIMGYSDITSLLLGINKMTGLVTFHGPVAISTFTDYTKKYFYQILTQTQPAGMIDDAPFSENLQTSNRIWAINGGKARGKLTGGNLTLICATLGTPYEIDTNDKILFIEEVGEEPYDLDRYLTQLKFAGKFDKCAGIFFDRMAKVRPAALNPSFDSSLSKEDVILDRLAGYDFPVCLGISIGHVADKPVLPLGVLAELDADAGKISILESAVS